MALDPEDQRWHAPTKYSTLHLNGHNICSQPNNWSLSEKLESLQQCAALVIIGAIRCSENKKLYHGLGLNLEKIEYRWENFVIK